MCRVRFGLTGIYFDSLEPTRPREEFVQPLSVSTPPVAQKKTEDAVPKTANGGKSKEKVMTANSFLANHKGVLTKVLNDSSSPSSRDEEGRRVVKNARTNHAIVGSEQALNSGLTSIASLSPSSASASDRDPVQKLANSKIELEAVKSLNNLRTSPKGIKTSSKRQKSTSPERLTNRPPAKRVRFAMDLPESVVSSNDTSSKSDSYSSDDSYTDPPSPTEPRNAFGNYHRMPFRSSKISEQVDRWRLRTPAEIEDSGHGHNSFLDSEDGSEIDIQDLPVKERSPRTGQAAKGPTLGQRHHQNNPTSLARSKRFTRVMAPSLVIAGGLEGSVDSGGHLETSYVKEKRPVSSLWAGKQVRHLKLRPGKRLPEPIFVVRPKRLSDATEKRKPADSLSGGRSSMGISKNRHQDTKTTPSRSTSFKASEEENPLKHCPMPIEKNLRERAEFDENLRMLIRDV